MSMEYRADKIADYTAVAQDILRRRASRQVILLEGPLGVGKTTFAKAILRVLQANEDEVNSPSFAIHNQYQTPLGDVDHLDLYRMESLEDLESTGFWDLFSQEAGLILIEWPERLRGQTLAPGWSIARVQIFFVGENSRRLCWESF